jgi:DNA-binding transcriptional regulator GbsR (MarR family)
MQPLVESFVSHFGEMGSRWGINRTVGQIYALLFVAQAELNADEIGEMLGISRSNVSIGLKELQAWRLVKLIRKPGDRREYFSSLGNVWDIFKTIAAERRRREVEPTLSMLRESLLLNPSSEAELHAQARMREMYELAELANNWFDDMQHLSPESLAQLMRLGTKVQKIFELKDRVKGVFQPSDAQIGKIGGWEADSDHSLTEIQANLDGVSGRLVSNTKDAVVGPSKHFRDE